MTTPKEQIELDILSAYRIIRGYEEIIRLGDRPEEKERARNWINNQWASIQGYLNEYRNMCPDLLIWSPEISQIATHWDEFHIQAGLDIEREKLAQEAKHRHQMRREQIVNRRPLDMHQIFHDRITELQTLRDHLNDSGVRLISVIGRAGMGKTALVCRLFEELERGGERELSGIVYLSARGGRITLSQLVSDIARLFDGETRKFLNELNQDSDLSDEDKTNQLLDILSVDKLYLFYLDNAEDMLDDKASFCDPGMDTFLQNLLTHPCSAKLVLTSRDPVQLPPAATRRYRSILLKDGLPEEEAIALLRDLDTGERGLREADEGLLRRAARLCHGIPRALELLAGQLDDFTLSLTSLLDDEERFRGQVVETLFADGYARLNEGERSVLRALAVLDKPSPTVAVEFLLHQTASLFDVPAALRTLSRSHIVTVDRERGMFSLHPLDREYVYNLDQSDLETLTALEHGAAEYYARLKRPKAEWKTIEDLRPHLDEWEHRVRAGEYDQAAALLCEIDYDYLLRWGYQQLLIEMWTRLLDQVVDKHLQWAMYKMLGLCNYHIGNTDQAFTLFQQMLQIAQGRNDKNGEGESWYDLGDVHRRLGQMEKARKCYEQALILARETGNARNEGISLGSLGALSYNWGHAQESIAYYEQALDIARKQGDWMRIGLRLGMLGKIYHDLGDLEQAADYYEQSSVIARELAYPLRECVALGNLGMLYVDLMQFDKAIDYLDRALNLAREIDSRRYEGYHLGSLGLVYDAIGQTHKAIQYHQQALDIARSIGDRRSESRQLVNIGLAYGHLNELEDGLGCYEQALEIDREIQDRKGEAVELGNIGMIHLRMGQVEKAIWHFKQALMIDQEIKYAYGQGYDWLYLSRAFVMQNSLSAAQDAAEHALLFNVPEIAHIAALWLGITRLRTLNQSKSDAEASHTSDSYGPAIEAFTIAINKARDLLLKTSELYITRYTLVCALVGLSSCARAQNAQSETALSIQDEAKEELRQAMEICALPGIVWEYARLPLDQLKLAGAQVDELLNMLDTASAPRS